MDVVDIGVIAYDKFITLQNDYLSKRLSSSIKDTILIVQHPSCFTMGRKMGWDNFKFSSEYINQRGVEIYQTNRGGDVTFHGPGQVVLYPIVDIRSKNIGIRKYLWILEEAGINVMSGFGYSASRREDYTGVWIDGVKIASIGVGVRNGVTFHGMSFNVNTQMDYFNWIWPCGIKDANMTSLEKLSGKKWDIDFVKKILVEKFIEVFNKAL